MTPRFLLRGALCVGLIGGLAGCQTAVGVSYGYGYSDPFYWNHYYHDRDVDIDIDVDRPDRPTRPPVAKPPQVRPPTHKPAPLPARPARPRLR
ncbi:MAG: hypothetical protein AAGI09_07470 [Pseudomonadota bacterium]